MTGLAWNKPRGVGRAAKYAYQIDDHPGIWRGKPSRKSLNTGTFLSPFTASI